jgi:exosortase
MSQPKTHLPEPRHRFLDELQAGWRAMPSKGLFLSLLALWIAFFHFLGNSTLGYIDTPSLFGWMHYAFNQLEDDRHCKYVPLVVLGLLWWKRRELLATPRRPWWPALVLVVLGLLLHVIGYMVQQTRISIAAFFLGVYGLIGMVWGWRFLRACFFPYFLFVFCVPVGTLADTLTFPLRVLVTNISVGFSHWVLGIDVVKQGTQILGAQGFKYDVAPACSGIRSLTVLLALTTIYGFTSFQAAWKRLLMMGMAVPLAVLGNVIRITGVIITAEAFGESAGMKFHDGAGFITFVVAMVVVMVLGYWLREEAKPAVPTREAAT